MDLAEAADVAKKRRLAGMVDFLRQSSSKSDEVSFLSPFHSFCIVVINYFYFIEISFCVSLKIHGLPIPYHIANGPNLLSLYSETNGNHGTL